MLKQSCLADFYLLYQWIQRDKKDLECWAMVCGRKAASESLVVIKWHQNLNALKAPTMHSCRLLIIDEMQRQSLDQTCKRSQFRPLKRSKMIFLLASQLSYESTDNTESMASTWAASSDVMAALPWAPSSHLPLPLLRHQAETSMWLPGFSAAPRFRVQRTDEPLFFWKKWVPWSEAKDCWRQNCSC